jgi:hypothetical protein
MTSIAFAFGSLPLAIATGASAASRIAIGTAVVGGKKGASRVMAEGVSDGGSGAVSCRSPATL